MTTKSKSAGGGWLVGCLILAILALLIGGAVAILINQIPDVSHQLLPNSAPLIVTLTEPLNGQSYPLSAALTVSVEAIGDKPITVLELWVNGALQQSQPARFPNLKYVTASWTWSAPNLGEHTLLVRALNTDGHVGQSNVVRLKAVEDAGSRLLYAAQIGDTATSIAQKFKVAPQQLVDLNPQIKSNTPITPGQTISVPIPPPPPAAPSGQPPPAPPSGPAQAPNSPPDKTSVWLTKNILNLLSPAKPPAAPGLSLKTDQCSVDLLFNDNANNEDGFFVYRLDPSASAFKRIATLGANSGALPIQYTDAGLSGQLQYYVAAFNAAGESASNLAGVSIIGAPCLTSYWKGLGLEKTQPDVQAVDMAYLYLSINNGAWQRLPQNPHEFLDPKKSSLDQVLNTLIPPSAQGIVIQGEVWGWKSGALTFLGNFKKTFPQDPAPIAPMVGLTKATDLEICSLGVQCPSDVTFWGKEAKAVTLFHWGFIWSPGSQVTSGLWQVSTQPFPSSPTLSPPGLVLAGKANAPSKGYEKFSVDLTPLVLQKIVQVLSPSGQATADSNAALLLNLQKSGGQVQTDPGAKPLLFGEISKDGAIDYYVRILPMQGNQPAGDPSNTVVLHYVPSEKVSVTLMAPPSPPPEVIHFNVEIAEFRGMKAPKQDHRGCVIVTGHDPQLVDPMGIIKSLWPVGSIRCPEIFTGGSKTGFAAFFDDLKSAFDFVADLYNKLTDFVVDLAAKLNPLCAQAKLVTNPDDVDKVCKFVAKIAVEAGKAYLGLPPSLPNYDQLTDLGKDYLTDLAAQELESKGIPCSDACKDLMKQGIDATTQQINQSKGSQYCEQSKAAENGWKPFCIPPGVLVKPDPEGDWQMPMLVLKVTRKEGTDNPKLPQPTKCSVSISSDATNDYWVKQYSYAFTTSSGYSWKPEMLKGPLFKSVSLPLPLLAPKQSVNIPISLVPVGWGGLPGWEHTLSAGRWLPGHYEAFAKIHTQGWPSFDDWHYYYEGAMVKINVGGSCELAGYEDYYQKGPSFGTNLQPAGKTMQGQEKSYGPLGW